MSPDNQTAAIPAPEIPDLKQPLVDALVRLLGSGDEADRCYCARALGVLAATDAVDTLATHLRDDDIDVCVDCAEALGSIGGATATEKLLEAFRNEPDSEILTAIVSSLSAIADPTTADELSRTITAPPENLQQDTDGDWDDWWDIQSKAIEAIGRMGAADTIPVIESLLESDEGPELATECMSALAAMDKAGFDAISRQVAVAPAKIRRAAARALRHGKAATTHTLLGNMLKDSDSAVRREAIDSLAAGNMTPYLTPISLLLDDDDDRVREQALKAVVDLSRGRDMTEKSLQALLALLNDPSATVQATALKSLSRTQTRLPQAARSAFMDLLQSGSEQVQCEAALALSAGFPDCMDTLLERLEDPALPESVYRVVIEAIGKCAPWCQPVETALLSGLRHDSRFVRLSALDSLIEIQRRRQEYATPDDFDETGPEYHSALELLVATVSGTFIETDTPESREAQPAEDAASPETESNTGSAAKTPNEIPNREDPGPQSTLEAILANNLHTAGAMSDETGENAPPGEIDMDPELEEFVTLMDQHRAKTEQSREKHSVDVEVEVQRLVARRLGEFDTEEVRDVLTGCLDSDDHELRKEAAMSLGVQSRGEGKLDKVLSELRMQLDNEQVDVRLAAARSLGRIAHPDDAMTLSARLSDVEPSMRIEATRALAAILPCESVSKHGSDTALQGLIGRLEDEEQAVRREAINGLVESVLTRPTLLQQINIEDLTGRAIDAAFMGADGQVNEIAAAIGRIARFEAHEMLLQRLATLETSAERRFAIEMLTRLTIGEPHGSRPLI